MTLSLFYSTLKRTFLDFLPSLLLGQGDPAGKGNDM